AGKAEAQPDAQLEADQQQVSVVEELPRQRLLVGRAEVEAPQQLIPARRASEGVPRLRFGLVSFCHILFTPSCATTTRNSPMLMTALTWKNALLTRLRSSGRTSECS